jgi:hypothetical protein
MTNEASRPSLGRILVERGVISEQQLDTALAVQRSNGGMLGEILTSRGWVTPLSIAAAVAKQRAGMSDDASPDRPARGSNWKPLGELLVERQLITDVQLKQALAVQRAQGGFIGEILIEEGWLAAADLVMALAAQLGLDFDVDRASANGREPAIVPSDRPEPYFEVLEETGDEVHVLKKTETFMEATDYVFDEVLWRREPGNLEIVRDDAGRRESVWSFRPGEASAHRRESLRDVFGYDVGHWEDKHGGELPVAQQDGEPPVAAAS